MSSGVEVPGSQRRPGIWSYFGFSGPRRRVSVSLPSNFAPNRDSDDPYEKHDRHSRHRSANENGFMNDYKSGAVMNQGQRLRYLKTGGVIAFILLVLYFVAPRDGLSRARGSHSSGGNTAAGGAKARCTTSYSKEKPLIQYALMIDAGSTGSRIHVYKFNNCGPSPELEDEIFEQTAKKDGGSGLSAYGEDAEGAAKSLDVLMDVAVKNVPAEYQGCTPVAVKATAGLRKLGEQKSNNTLAAVRNRLETAYPFPLVSAEKNGVEVMPGEMEGVYAWITVNYLLGHIGGPDKNPTAAVLDLGGGSTQIIFEPTFPDSPRGGLPTKLADGDHKYTLNFGSRDFALYQHSYLGYGLMEARNNLHATLVDSLYQTNKATGSTAYLQSPIVNPCIAPGMSREVAVHMPKDHPLGASVTVNMTGPSTAAPTQCRGWAEKTLHKDDECKIAPCAFRGVHQPPFEQTFAREAVYLLSYFYDRTQDLGMPESFTLRELQDLADRVCQGEKAWDVFAAVPKALDELKGRPEWCLDLNFQYELLRSGYGMPIDREVKIAKKIKNRELGWCLGASLPLLEANSGWQCKIKQVQ
ncbi:guanosine-diphosphatase [Cucurbitaria berberidis CBS 394.84]|uniref:guanosine-diphosphatase n=1 Tax=Cucurbitaria berberidis CBS 394.84 TaxID=1168544 RepID=A0A9P4GLE7_9PLEO|nr:guanosine-diphosphatase [Cucurbitaria berberidis CBS 394.84]KAF1847210.1 guanosine-diphosphatase [Cucurbitaria berberidis CBS 394.84]